MVNTPKKWLITGGCGFIGTSLIQRLILNDPASTIRVIDNLSTGTRDDLARVATFFETDISSLKPISLNGTVELVQGDIRDQDIARTATQGTDIVVHLAANTGVQPSIVEPIADMEANVVGTVNYLEACRQNKITNFIFASSGAPIGEGTPPLHEEMPCHPISPYGASKLAGEAYCSAYHGSYGLKTVALRFSNVYGPLSGHKNSVVARFINQAMHDEPWTINGDGSQTRDFLYVDDLVEAIILAAGIKKGGEVFQIATQQETSITDMANLLAKLLQNKTGGSQVIRYGTPLPGDVIRNFADISKANNTLGWTPQVQLEEGLMRTVKWFWDGLVKDKSQKK